MTGEIDPVGEALAELSNDPDQFSAKDGYRRLVALLRKGDSPDALKQWLRGDAGHTRDLLWTVVQLDRVEPFVSEALQHILSKDKGTAAYALEVVLRGSRDSAQLEAALERLRSCDTDVCEHAARTLAAEGLARVGAIFQAGAWPWAAAITNRFLYIPLEHKAIEDLVSKDSRDHHIVGVVLATLANEADDGEATAILKHSQNEWIRDYGRWLETIRRAKLRYERG